jgi:uncharacterized protein YndB with AHSA1/START domain
MPDYQFVSTWRFQAPVEKVWEEIFHTERWPSWWRYVRRVDQLDPGDDSGVGRGQHLVFTTRLPYRLGFDIRVRRAEPPSVLEADATGELEGVGRWTLTLEGGGRWSATTGMCGHQMVEEPGRAARPAGLHLEPRCADA